MTTPPARLEIADTTLVVIDMQERFRDIIDGMDRVMAGCSRLLRFCDRLEIPMVVTEHYPQGLGATLTELRNLFGSFHALEKISFSCAGDPDFLVELRKHGRNQIVLCGIEAHVCVYQTALDLLSRGHQVAVATDAVSSRKARNREIGLARMRDIGVEMMSVEMIMFELLKVAKTDEFKLVADILKED